MEDGNVTQDPKNAVELLFTNIMIKEEPKIHNFCEEILLNSNEYTNHVRNGDPLGSHEYKNSKNTISDIGSSKEHFSDNKEINGLCPVRLRALTHSTSTKEHSKFGGEPSTIGKILECSQCLKNFVKSDELRRHMSVHTGNKNYECTICLRKFSHRSGLRGHMILHSGIRKYECTICSKKFPKSSHLKYHMIMHSGVKSFVCSLCPKKFGLKGNLKQHILTVHSRISSLK